MSSSNNISKPSPLPTEQSTSKDIQNKEKSKEGFNIKSFLRESEETLTAQKSKQQERLKIHEKLTKAYNALNKFKTDSVIDPELGPLGTKIIYLPDKDGKTIYDYAQDKEVAEHIKFDIPEDDPQDGTPVRKQINHYWINPLF